MGKQYDLSTHPTLHCSDLECLVLLVGHMLRTALRCNYLIWHDLHYLIFNTNLEADTCLPCILTVHFVLPWLDWHWFKLFCAVVDGVEDG